MILVIYLSNVRFLNTSILPTILRFSIEMDEMFVNDMNFINELNAAQSSWVAGGYHQFEALTNRQILSMAGKRNTKIVP